MEAIDQSKCAHDWDFDGENAEGTQAEFSCHLCGLTSVAKKPLEIEVQAHA